MKVNKVPLIVTAVLTVIFAIAAAVCFLLPAKDNGSPVQFIDGVGLSYSSYEGGYKLNGKVKNVSDKEVILYSDQSILVYFDDSYGSVFWVRFETKTVKLLPGEEFDLRDSTNVYTSNISIDKVKVEIDGVRYEIYGTRINSVLILLFIVLTIIFLAVTITSAVGVKNASARIKSIEALVNQMGGGIALKGTIGDKDETMKNAAKSAGSVAVGATFAFLFGFGSYKIYRGSGKSDFILTDNLYVLNGNGKNVNAGNLQIITKNDFPAASVTVKKNSVIVDCIDNRRAIRLFTDKNSGITAEQLAEKINGILVNAPDPVPVQNEAADPFAEDGTVTSAADPFAEDGAVTAQPETKTEE